MELSYIKVFLDWKERTRRLNFTEKGRLIDALVDYANRVEDAEAQLKGNEAYVFPVFQIQIDRDREELAKYSAKQAENGRKGGRPKNPQEPTETQQNPKNPPLFEETQKSYEIRKKKKEKEEEYIDIFAAYSVDDAELLQTLRDFEEMRKKMKSPMTDRAKQLLCSKLDRTCSSSQEKISLLEKSIVNGWKDIYPEQKKEQSAKAPLVTSTPGELELRMLRRLG